MGRPNEKCPACSMLMTFVSGDENDYYVCRPCRVTLPVAFYDAVAARLLQEHELGYATGFREGKRAR